jgi:hypothetical protein
VARLYEPHGPARSRRPTDNGAVNGKGAGRSKFNPRREERKPHGKLFGGED